MAERKIEKEKEKDNQGEWAKEALRKRERIMAKGRIAPQRRMDRRKISDLP